MLLPLLFMLGCRSPDPIVGEWRGESAFGEAMRTEFAADGALTVAWPSGTKHGTWRIDRKAEPIALDLDLDDREVLETIAKFPTPDVLIIGDVGGSDDRPTDFDGPTLRFAR